MFSKELVDMIEQFNNLRKTIEMKIIEESHGLATMGHNSRFNVHVREYVYEDLTVEDLEKLVGPVEFEYNYEGNNCFKYNIGNVPAYTLLDEKITRAGGAADDVRANAQT